MGSVKVHRKVSRVMMRVFLIFLAVFSFSLPAQAQKILDDFKKPMPDIKLAPEAEFNAQSTAYEEVPLGDKALSYKVRLPKDWEEVKDGGLSNYSLSDKIFGEVARFFSPPRLESARSRFTIQAVKLDYQLTAEQWLLQYLLSNGYAIQGMATKDDTRVEALYVLIEDDISYIVRAVAEINGKRVILAQYYLPIEFWDIEKFVQAQVLSTFALTNPDHELVENMLKYQFLDIAEMSYPDSWELRSPPLRSIDFMDAQLLNIASGVEGVKDIILNGKIEARLVSVFAADSIESEVANLKTEFQKTGLSLQEVFEKPENFTSHKLFKNRKVEVYKASDSKSALIDYELWLVTMEAGDYYYFLTLLTPSRDEDYFIWSRNTQTFKVVTSLIVPQEESISDR